MIQCNQINQTINTLKASFQKCKVVNPEDLLLMVELIAAVNQCAGGGAEYNELISVPIITTTDAEVITMAPNTLHSFSINVLAGSIVYKGFTFTAGSTRNYEFTTLNQSIVSFVVNPNSQVLFEYLIETI